MRHMSTIMYLLQLLGNPGKRKDFFLSLRFNLISMSLKFLEKIAIADIAFEVTAKTRDGLFEQTGLAAADIIFNPKTVKQKVKKKIELKADSLEHLLYDFLSEIIYLKDTDGLL